MQGSPFQPEGIKNCTPSWDWVLGSRWQVGPEKTVKLHATGQTSKRFPTDCLIPLNGAFLSQISLWILHSGPRTPNSVHPALCTFQVPLAFCFTALFGASSKGNRQNGEMALKCRWNATGLTFAHTAADCFLREFSSYHWRQRYHGSCQLNFHMVQFWWLRP